MQFHGSYGSWFGTPEPTWSLADPAQPNKGVVLTFKNGASSCGPIIETAKIVLLCDPVRSIVDFSCDAVRSDGDH